jgi:5'-3' exonuclease
VPGLDGFGEKGAATLLAKFVQLEDIPDDVRQWPAIRGADRLAATLEAERADAMLYRELTRLRRDVPLAESLDQLSWSAPAAGFNAWCERMQAMHLQRRAVA